MGNTYFHWIRTGCVSWIWWPLLVGVPHRTSSLQWRLLPQPPALRCCDQVVRLLYCKYLIYPCTFRSASIPRSHPSTLKEALGMWRPQDLAWKATHFLSPQLRRRRWADMSEDPDSCATQAWSAFGEEGCLECWSVWCARVSWRTDFLVFFRRT